jgi:hypothetical protein
VSVPQGVMMIVMRRSKFIEMLSSYNCLIESLTIYNNYLKPSPAVSRPLSGFVPRSDFTHSCNINFSTVAWPNCLKFSVCS